MPAPFFWSRPLLGFGSPRGKKSLFFNLLIHLWKRPKAHARAEVHLCMALPKPSLGGDSYVHTVNTYVRSREGRQGMHAMQHTQGEVNIF